MNDIHFPFRLIRQLRASENPSTTASRRTLRRTSRLLCLEQRFMFDAAAVATAADAAHVKADAHHAALLAEAAASAQQLREADASRNGGKKEVVFVDTSISGYKTLEAGLPEGFAVVEIDGTKDGLAQMAKWAETHTGYDAIHILSHAAEGKLELGTALLSDSSLGSAKVQAEWAAVGHALNAGGDLMVYGCDLAKGTDGDLFIHDLAKATGADVAASTDLTGAASKGANWILEKQVGDVTASAFSVDGFNDTLGNIVTGNDPGASNTDVNTISTTSGLFDIGQSFTATKTGLLTTLTLYASFSNGGTATLNIYSGDGTGGTLLGSQSLSPFNDAGTLDTGNNRYIGTDITLNTPISVTNGNVYTFQITTTDFISLTYTNQSNYAGGTLYQDGADQGSSYDLEFYVTQADANAAPVNNVAPAISGTQTVGNALSATTGTWTDPDSDSLTYSYQWYRADDNSGTNATAIGSATSSSYTLTSSDAHKYVRVVVTADDGNGHTPTANAAWTAVNDTAPSNSVTPALSGTATVGNALSTTTGTWSDADGDSLTYSYQWYRADDGSGTNATAIGSATSSSYTLTSPDGNHYVRAVVTANDGHGSANQTAASPWTAVATVPSVSSIVRTGGASATVNHSDTSVSYTVTFSESVTGVDASDFALTETGTASGNIASVLGSGTTYTVTVDTIDGDGTLRLDLNSSGTGIKNGSSVDIAGGYTSGATYTLDHTAPNAPSTPDMSSGTDSGSSNSDNLTQNTTPIFSGTAENGSTVTLYDTDGTTVLGVTTATGGNWTITASTMSAGDHTVTAKATDAAGNVSSASSGLSVTIDADAPTGLNLSDTTIASQNTTSTSTIATLSSTDAHAVTYSLATGNGTNDADNGSFTISGTSLKVGASSLTAGTYKIYVAATDTAGNVANQAFTITIVDAPSVSSVARTGGASSTVSQSASSVSYTVTFSESVTGVDATDFALTATGTASGNIASVTGSGATYTVIVDTLSGDGTLRLDLNGSGTGIQNGSSVDIAGGYTSGATYTLDHTAPNAPSTPDMSSGTDSGSSNSDNVTQNTTPVFSGTAENGSTVTLYDTDGTTVLGTTTATGGNWTITASTMSSGAHTVTAKATDAAGNVSSASSGLNVTIDTTAPTVSSVSVPSNGSYKAGQTLSFTVNTDEAVTVDTSGGTPRIALTVGGSTVYANYASGSGSTALVFSYTVQAGDTDADGIAVGALQANGGTLKDTAGNGMTLALNSVGSTSSVLVDTTAPTVASVSVPADGTYHTGQNIDFTVNFSEAVTVDTTGGTPRIAVTLDTGGTVYADYQSGSGTSAVVFRYTVGSGTMDNTGITVGALGANGGTLRDAAGNDATLTLNSVGSTAAVNVDGSQPHVLDVSSTTANASYGVGATVSVSVTFSTAVAVDTSGGTPTLALADGGVATYSTGSGSSTLVFTYHVAGGENTTDLDYASTGALALNGGTIKDSGGSHVDALLTLATPGAAHSLGANKDIVIDTTPPAITFTNLAFSHDTGASDTDFVTDVASQTITATLSGAPASGDIVYGSLDNGATWSNITGKVSGTTLTWDNVTLSGNGTLKLKVTDSVGNDGAVAVQAYTLWSGAPSLTFSKLSLSNDTGISSTDFITKAAGQTIGATLSAPLTSGDIVYGSLDGGATWTDITAKMSGTTLSWNGVTLAGSGTLMLKVTDAFGHDGAATSHAYTLDTAAPTTGVATAAFSKDTGASASDFITSATDQTVSGTLSANLAAGETVQVSLDGGATWSEASATAGQSAWSLAGQTLMSSNTLMVKVSDAAGNDGPVFSQAYVLQAEAPAIVFSGLALSDDTGVSNSDFVTRAANQTVTATLNAPLGAGDAVYGSLDGGATWTDVTAKISGTRLAWDGVVLTGNGTLMIKAVNASGTDGTATSHAYVLDTVAPNAPTVVSGDTSSVTPTLTGTASLGEGESLAVSVGGATYHVVPVNGSWRLDLGSAIPASGSLSLTVGNSYGVTATVSDAAGNTRDASGTLTIAPPPTQPANTTPLPLPVAQGANPQNPDTPAGSTENTGKPASSPPPAPVLSFTPPESPLAVSLGGNAVNSAPISQHPIDIGAGLQSAAPGFSLRTSAPAGDLTRSDGGFPIEVTAFSGSSNGGLTLNRGMSDQTISGESAVVLVPSDAFVHTDPGATVHLTAQQANGRALPSWVSFDAINGKFTVRPPAGVKGEISIKVIARDSQGREAVTTFKIKLDRNAQTHASLDHHGRAALSEQVREAANGASDRMNRLARAAEWLNS